MTSDQISFFARGAGFSYSEIDVFINVVLVTLAFLMLGIFSVSSLRLLAHHGVSGVGRVMMGSLFIVCMTLYLANH